MQLSDIRDTSFRSINTAAKTTQAFLQCFKSVLHETLMEIPVKYYSLLFYALR